MRRKELTEKSIGCAYRVYNRMGTGFLESVYEKCLVLESRPRRDGKLRENERSRTFRRDEPRGTRGYPVKKDLSPYL